MLPKLTISFLRRTGSDKIISDILKKNKNKFYQTLAFSASKISENRNDIDLRYHSMQTQPEYWHTHYTFRKDKIPLIKIDGEEVVNPVTIAQYGLVCYNQYYLTKENYWKDEFLNQVRFLSEMDPNLYYQFDLKSYNLKKPWVSGLAYGTAISLLVRAELTESSAKNKELIGIYLEKIFNLKENGGVFTSTPEGLPWIEEYPSAKSSYVYNGFVTAFTGLLECKIFLKQELPLFVNIENLERSAIETLRFYDIGLWLRYDRINKKIINPYYMNYHINQFQHLFLLTGNKTYLKIRSRLKKMYQFRFLYPYYDAYIYS